MVKERRMVILSEAKDAERRFASFASLRMTIVTTRRPPVRPPARPPFRPNCPSALLGHTLIP